MGNKECVLPLSEMPDLDGVKMSLTRPLIKKVTWSMFSTQLLMLKIFKLFIFKMVLNSLRYENSVFWIGKDN